VGSETHLTKEEEPIVEHILGTYRNGVVQLHDSASWPEGASVMVLYTSTAAKPIVAGEEGIGHAIIAGYGLAGRFIADVFRRHDAPFLVVEQNLKTVQIQRELGANIIGGDIRDEAVLRQADISRAAVLALTIPDEVAVLEATQIARRMNPNIYIVARTQYASVGLEAAKLGADEVVQAEYAVAVQFYQSFLRKLQAGGPGGKSENGQ
jgi:CPA2 family monovalent cation:H+ antiporter-2